MTKFNIYIYTSNNGTVCTPINLGYGNPREAVRLIADGRKILTNGTERQMVVEVPTEETSLWTEVEMTETELAEYYPIVESTIGGDTSYQKLLDIVTGADKTE